jgi:hypothetical protein
MQAKPSTSYSNSEPFSAPIGNAHCKKEKNNLDLVAVYSLPIDTEIAIFFAFLCQHGN